MKASSFKGDDCISRWFWSHAGSGTCLPKGHPFLRATNWKGGFHSQVVSVGFVLQSVHVEQRALLGSEFIYCFIQVARFIAVVLIMTVVGSFTAYMLNWDNKFSLSTTGNFNCKWAFDF